MVFAKTFQSKRLVSWNSQLNLKSQNLAVRNIRKQPKAVQLEVKTMDLIRQKSFRFINFLIFLPESVSETELG